MHNHHSLKINPRIIAWEVTKRCPLKCKHCRASASDQKFDDEFTLDECYKVLDNIASFAKPIIILTGGEPMIRHDIYDISKYGTELGLRMVMAPCGILMDKSTINKIKESGIARISLSIDGANKTTHDEFRQLDGAFDSVIKAAKLSKEEGLEFQINSTITKLNYKEIDKILKLAVELGAVSFHPFLLVPTGRAKNLVDLAITADEYEDILNWIYERIKDSLIQIKPTCAPHFYRILHQRENYEGRTVSFDTHGINAMTKGCLGGQSFAFISNTGSVQICGFLDNEAGNIRRENYNFQKIWNTSDLFKAMRNIDEYHGKCGICEYRKVCGGCRARAFALTGDYLAEEPFCVYETKKVTTRHDKIR